MFCYYAHSLYSRVVPDCANYLAFDASFTPFKTGYAQKNISWLGVKGQIKCSTALWCFSRGKSLCLTLKHIYFPILPSHTTHPPTHLTSDNWGPPVPQPIDSLALNLNLEATETTIKEALSLSKTDCRPNNTCSLSLISPFIEWTTYPQLSWTFWPFSSCGMRAFPVYRRCPIYSDGSPDDNNLHTPLGVTRPVLVAGSQRGPLTYNVWHLYYRRKSHIVHVDTDWYS